MSTRRTTAKPKASNDAPGLPPPAPKPPIRTLPDDPASRRRDISNIYINDIGANIIANQLESFVSYRDEQVPIENMGATDNMVSIGQGLG